MCRVLGSGEERKSGREKPCGGLGGGMCNPCHVVSGLRTRDPLAG